MDRKHPKQDFIHPEDRPDTLESQKNRSDQASLQPNFRYPDQARVDHNLNPSSSLSDPPPAPTLLHPLKELPILEHRPQFLRHNLQRPQVSGSGSPPLHGYIATQPHPYSPSTDPQPYSSEYNPNRIPNRTQNQDLSDLASSSGAPTAHHVPFHSGLPQEPPRGQALQGAQGAHGVQELPIPTNFAHYPASNAPISTSYNPVNTSASNPFYISSAFVPPLLPSANITLSVESNVRSVHSGTARSSGPSVATSGPPGVYPSRFLTPSRGGHHRRLSSSISFQRSPTAVPMHLEDLESPRKRIRRLSQDQDMELKRQAFEAAAQPLNQLAQQIIAQENEEEKLSSQKLTHIPHGVGSGSGSGSGSGPGPGSATVSSAKSHSRGSSLSMAGGASASYLGAPSIPKDRQKQIFAMVWLLGACETLPTAVVPRNRIYARYVQICADNGLKPLSPASFGKLIRILFPNLTTRRLGVRGQSKYHYCGVKLVDEAVESPLSSQSNNDSLEEDNDKYKDKSQNKKANVSVIGEEVGYSEDEDDDYTGADLSIVVGTPLRRKGLKSAAAAVATTSATTSASGSRSIQKPDSASYSIVFIPNLLARIDSLIKSNLKLPLLVRHLLPAVDRDIADTLHLLYRVHCNQLFSALRYMQIKNLFSSFLHFIGIVTTPILKLWVHQSLNEWVNNCDMITYRAMTKMLAKLHSQSVPMDVRYRLKEIADQFIPQLVSQLEGKVPLEFLEQRISCAQNFVRLLRRLLPVLETGFSAAKMLSIKSERLAMLRDWQSFKIEKVCRFELPCNEVNVNLACKILEERVPLLLQGTNRQQHSQGDLLEASSSHTQTSLTGSHLDEISLFLSSIPAEFEVTPYFYLVQATNLLTACLREMSFTGGQRFGSWWVLRCWVDEFYRWFFELGAMLEQELGSELDEQSLLLSEENQSTDIFDLLGGSFDLGQHEVNDPNFDVENILGKPEDHI